MLNKTLHIHLTSATCPDAITVGMLHGTVIQQTEKAYGISLENKALLWIPAKALQRKKIRPEAMGSSPVEIYKLAHWFRPDRYQRKIIAENMHHGHIAA